MSELLLGSKFWETTQVKVNIFVYIEEETIVAKTILGIPVEWKNETSERLKYTKAELGLNPFGEVVAHDLEPFMKDNPKFIHSIIFNVNFERTIMIYQYYGISDVLSSLGGLKSIITPFFTLFSPVFVLVFLIHLS